MRDSAVSENKQDISRRDVSSVASDSSDSDYVPDNLPDLSEFNENLMKL